MTVTQTSAVNFPTPLAPFTMTVTSEMFEGVRDDVLNWGYNIAAGSGRKLDASEPQLKFDVETNFRTNGRNLMEWNFDYRPAGDGTDAYKRFLHWQVDRESHEGQWYYYGNLFLVSAPLSEPDGKVQHYVVGGPGQGSLTLQTYVNRSAPNNVTSCGTVWDFGDDEKLGPLRLSLGFRPSTIATRRWVELKVQDNDGSRPLKLNPGGTVQIDTLEVKSVRLGKHLLTLAGEDICVDGRRIPLPK